MLGEKLISRKLSNGLECGLIPRVDFVKKFAVIAAKFGSIDNKFISPRTGEKVMLPAGVAHFLEHKMFDKKWGSVFDRFSSLGANANAFTSHTVTAYHFTCTNNFWESLELLLETVGSIYLTRENVRKEVGIIQQEIMMYCDSPEWRLATNLLEGLYHRHPVRLDTAGTVESVSKITKKMLLECFKDFYSPANMMLAVAGAIEPEEFFERCEGFTRRRRPLKPPELLTFSEPDTVKARETVYGMKVNMPKVLMGFKECKPARGGERLVRQSLEADLLLSMIFGKSSPVYLRFYESGVIDESFSASYVSDRGFGYSALGGDAASPERFVNECLKAIERMRKKGVSKRDFSRTKKRLLGAYLRRFNSLEASAVRAISGRFLKHNPFKVLEVLDSITLKDMNRRMSEHLREESMSISIVQPVSGDSGKSA